MAENVFAILPTEYEQRKAQAASQDRELFEAPKPPAQEDGSPDYTSLASKYQVPANVIQAMTDNAGLSDPSQVPAFAERVAATVGQELAAGKDVPTALTTLLGDETATADLLKYADGIAQARAPKSEVEEPEPEQSRIGKAFKQGTAQAISTGHEGARRAAAAIEEGALGRTLAKMRQAVGVEGETPEARAAVMRDQPMKPAEVAAKDTLEDLAASGFEVASWRDIRGVASAGRFIAENTAMMLPQMAAGIASGGAQPGVVLPMMSGEVFQELDDKLPDMPEADKANVAGGAATAMWAFETLGLGAVMGKMLPSDIAQQALSGELSETLVKAGWKRSAARVLEAGITEGSTEAIQEGIIMGATAASGGEYERQEVIDRLADSFAGGAGAGAGIRSGVEPVVAAQERREARAGTEQGGDGDTSAGEPPQPEAAPQRAPAPAATPRPTTENEVGGAPEPASADTPAPERPPSGPLSTAAQRAPDLRAPGIEPGTPVEVATPDGEIINAEFVAEGPGGVQVRDERGEFLIPRADLEAGGTITPTRRQAQRFPDMKPGKETTLKAPDGQTYRATFLEETREGVAVRIGGERVELTDQEFDLALDAAFLADGKGKPKGEADTPVVEEPAAQDSEDAAPDLDMPRPTQEPQRPMPEEAAPEGQSFEDAGRMAEVQRQIAAVEAEEGVNLQPQERDALAQTLMQEGEGADVAGATRAALRESPEATEQAEAVDDVPWPEVDAAAQEADPAPTEAQKEAGNYKKGHTRWKGLDISIENARGSERRGKDRDGNEWSVKMPAHYGYVRGTEGADGDHVDVYVGENPDSDAVWVVDQMDAETGRFDEHKALVGFSNAMEASDAYKAGFSDEKGADRLGGIRKMTADDFKAWLNDGDTKKPITPKAKRQDAEARQNEGGGEKISPVDETSESEPEGQSVAIEENEIDRSPATGPKIINPSQAVKKEDLTYVTDAYGDRHRVLRSALDGDRKMLRRYNQKGEPLEGNAALLARGNIDTDGSKVRATYSDAQIIAGRNDKPLATDDAVWRKIARFGQELTDFEVRKVEGGYIGVRKQKSEPDREAAGPRVMVNKVGRDGKTDAERGMTYDEALEKAKDRLRNMRSVEMSGGVIFESDGEVRVGNVTITPEDYQRIESELDAEPGTMTIEERDAAREAQQEAELEPGPQSQSVAVDESAADQDITPQQPAEVEPDTYGWDAMSEDQRQTAISEAGFVGVVEPTDKWSDLSADAKGEINKAVQRRQRNGDMAAETPATPAPSYGAENRLVSRDRAAELRERLKAKLEDQKTQLNAGIDPEMLAIGTELAVYHIEAGARSFVSLTRAIAADLGTQPATLKPYLRSWYNGARDMMEDNGVSIDGMDDADTVRAVLRSGAVDDMTAGELPEAADSGSVADEPTGDPADAGGEVRSEPDEPLEAVGSESLLEDEGGRDADAGGAPEGARSGGSRNRDDAAGDAPARGRGNRSGRAVSTAPKRPVSRDQKPEPKEVAASKHSEIPAQDFTITDELELGVGGEVQKFNDNIAAIELLKQIEADKRRATPEEQAVLARYVGWGGLANAFRPAGSKPGEGYKKGWEERQKQVEALLEPEELATARNSTKAAHYTSEPVVRGLWTLAERVGFNGGAVLEPSVGIGNFLGLMPEGLRGKSRVMAVEYDGITARLSKLLYPNQTVFHSGFQDVPLPEGKFSLAIGNPPFGRDSLTFQHLPGINRKTIHHQFFEASMHALAPEGTLAMVVSRFIMDGRNSQNRESLARQGELVGAIRLPSSAFKGNARTEVVTDIIVLRKHSADPSIVNAAVATAQGRDKEADKAMASMSADDIAEVNRLADNFRSWLPGREFADPAGSDETLFMNEYFHRNPKMVLGDIAASGTMNRSNELSVTLPADDIPARLDEAISSFPSQMPSDGIAERTMAGFDKLAEAMALSLRGAEPGAVRVDDDGRLVTVIEQDGDTDTTLTEIELTEDTPYTREYFFGDDGKWRREVDALDEEGSKIKRVNAEGKKTNLNVKEVEVIEDLSTVPGAAKWGKKRIQQLRDMLDIRDAFKRQVELEAQDAPEDRIEENRAKLNEAYRTFKKAHGPLHQPRIRNIADNLPDGGLILAVENVTSAADAKTLTVEDADILSGRVMIPPERRESAENLEDAISISLSETGGLDIERMAGLLGQNPDEVTQALSEGESPRGFYDPEQSKWVTADEYLSGEVRRKLAAAERANLDGNVTALKGVAPEPWGPAEITPALGANWIPRQVYADFLKHLGYSGATVQYQALTNTYTVNAQGSVDKQWETNSPRSWAISTIAASVMNSSTIKITYKDSDDKTYVDQEATDESQAKAEELANEFQDWVFAEDTRRDQLVEIFNNKFNTRVTRQRDGSHLELPSANPAIKLRRHQKNAIWRGVTDPAVLFDHVVGAGKTYAAIGRIMERRRMGLSRKPMVVVPNHLTEQWGKEWLELYPGAKLLVAGKKDFEKANRRRLFGRIAAGDYDGIIIGHSQITRIPIDPAIETRYLEQELQDALKAVKEAEEQAAEDGLDGGRFKPMGVKEAERLVTKLEERLAKVRARSRDKLITFQQMGVDDLTIDEAHEFKNLAYSSRLTGVSGMGNKEGSQKAIDLHLKLRALHDEGSSMAFLTGTPISNSVSEMYLLLRNLVPDQLREMGLENFDAWRTMFVTATTEWEPTEAGGLKEVTRLGREWTNMRTLMDLYYSVADAVTLDDLKSAHAEDNNGARFPVPAVKGVGEGEARRMIAVTPGPKQSAVLDEVVQGFESLPNISDPFERNAERLRLMDKARKIALDARAVDPSNEGDADGGKIGAVVGEIDRIYREWNDDKGAQIVFLDRSVPQGRGDKKVVAEYDAAMKAYDQAVKAGDESRIAAAEAALDKFDKNDIDARRVAIAGGWNAYSEIKDQLVARGIPEDEIAFVQDANNDKQKAILFDRVRRGEVRVLLGSTPRMGAGTNVQERLVGLHHVDVTWKPSDIEQREGRIIRQGNELLAKYGHDNFGVEVIAYATERTVDAKMWDLNGQKLKAINGIRKYDGRFLMEFEDAESASMAEMAALATGNPLMVERIKLDGARKKLMGKQRLFNRRRNAMRAQLQSARRLVETADEKAAYHRKAAETIEAARAGVQERAAQRSIEIEGKTYNDREQAEIAAQDAIAEQRGDKPNARFKIKVNGLPITKQEDIQKQLRSAFGAEGFEATVAGETFIDPTEAGKAMAAALNTSLAEQDALDQKSLDGLTVMGLPVEVTTYESYGGDMASNVSVVIDGEDVWENTYYSKNGQITSGEFAATIRKISKEVTSRAARSYAEGIEGDKARAEQAIPNLEEEAEAEWPEAGELEDINKRLEEVMAGLDGAQVPGETVEGEAVDVTDESGNLQGKRRVSDQGVPYTKAAAKEVVKDLNAELDATGLRGKVRLHLAPQFNHQGQTLDGYFLDGMIGVGLEAPAGAKGILRHEIIHALRNRDLWGRSHGLFTPNEWRTLVKAARADKRIMDDVRRYYPDLNATGQVEEAIAEKYREWAESQDREATTPVGRALDKLRRMIEAITNAFQKNGMNEATAVFDRIRTGEIGARGGNDPTPGGGGGLQASRARSETDRSPRGLPFGDSHIVKKPGEAVSNYLTDWMGGRVASNMSSLGVIPGRPLLEEMGKRIPALKRYLRLKEQMDADRQQLHAETDTIAQSWIELGGKDTEANGRMMDLMHRSTIAGVFPNKVYTDEAWQGDDGAQRKASWERLRKEFLELPREFQRMFGKVEAEYTKMGNEFEKAVLESVKTAQAVAVRKAKRAYDKAVERAERDGLDADELTEAVQEAKDRLDAAESRVGWAQQARLAALRSEFESNKLQGPYFPLARFGKYFVAGRNPQTGRMETFSRFEREEDQAAEIRRLEDEGMTAESGVLGDQDGDLKGMVDPNFVADIEELIAGSGADEAVMDAVWQRWLETLPDASVRKNRIHRKGRAGYSKDALRAFTHHMFHGAHQLARLRYGMKMSDELDQAYEEAAEIEDTQQRNRSTLVVDEAVRRHKETMRPSVASWASWASGLAFGWYLAVTAAAALINVSQTTVVGVPIMKANFRGVSLGRIMSELGRAAGDFASGGWKLEGALEGDRLTEDERAALKEAHKRGIVDKTQAHDIASVAETGVEYSGVREKWMKRLSFLFHKAEVLNREATFLASYRLAREQGDTMEQGVDKAGSLTWKIHFDYQHSSRPRFMQNDYMRVLTIFRQFTVNMLYRMGRDMHQSLKGASAEERREARTQLAGITLSMAAHAGITGVAGYGLVMSILGLVLPGDDDDVEEWITDALLLEGDSMGVTAFNFAMGMALKGIPGHATGVDLTSRIGMANLWFRAPYRDLDAEDSIQHYMNELLGPIPSIIMGVGRGVQYVFEGDVYRGVEAATPKAINDVLQAGRYAAEGVKTRRGDTVLEDVPIKDIIVQAFGFTPAAISEVYDDASRMRQLEADIMENRSRLQQRVGDAVLKGKPISDKLMRQIREFNKAHPTYPITKDTLRRSVQGRVRYSEGVEAGVNINPKLRQQIEESMAPRLY